MNCEKGVNCFLEVTPSKYQYFLSGKRQCYLAFTLRNWKGLYERIFHITADSVNVSVLFNMDTKKSA